ncbi:MAG: PTS fructose transporter subunit IIA [Deltaproteobacteria bacterium CG_4_8_14_3_um_filter_45_9]|nr:MAG: PTS fructose transporter subunit IIA [Deltaproteobacteria bacterium CG03_land_8_20_14_0_80_45_14]PIX22129.1 MAG: PTS fructose transporter subunit IIA [Deltaproteobacteria bacterium CG_4_8_14_3_um_filter_45_9]
MRWSFKKNKELRMVGILIVSHGRLAEALISSIQFLVGNLQKIRGVSIWPKDKGKEVKDRIRNGIKEVNDGDGVVILTDVLGGTPTNLSLSFLENEKVEVVTGVNMPMLLTLSSYRKGRSLREIGKLVKKSGRRGIILAKELLRSRRGK